MVCKWQVEINPFAREVLAKRHPQADRFEDVTECCGSPLRRSRADTRCAECGRRDFLPRVDVIAGGFPCQDVSVSGSGAGLDGERSGLWVHMHRLVDELRPRVVLVENVAALAARGLGRVLGDLAAIGFDAEWSDLFACEMGCTHPRRRLFIVAYADGQYGRERLRDRIARAFRPLQTVDDFASARARHLARLADPSALYRGADGVPDRLERNRGIGNAVCPDCAEWIGRRVIEALSATQAA